jgi:tetratricopeptide (TPR) repeat protein
MIFVRSTPTLFSVLGLLLLASCGTPSVIERSQKFASLGDYKHAYEEIRGEYRRQLDAGSVDERIAKAHDEMRLKYLRDRAQQLIFTEREDDALDVLDRLDSFDPDYPGTARLRHAALLKKAERIVNGANEQLARKDFVSAMEGYLESQRLVPGFEPAEDGIAKVREETARMSARAQQQFLQAVRKVPEFRHIEVAWHAAAVIHLTPDATDEQRADAAAIGANAKRESAKLTLDEARACEQENQFGAALVLYKAALLLDPELTEAGDAIEKMKGEMTALGLLEKAQIAMRTEDFVEANNLLKEAHSLSMLSRAEISELMLQATRLEGEKHYREARDLEVMGKKEQALVAFEALAKQFPNGLKDEEARIVGLKVDVESAKAAWAEAEKAEAAGELQKALDQYVTAESFYAEWRDGEAHIERLRKAIAAQAAEQGNGG